MRNGKAVILEGLHLDPGMLLAEFGALQQARATVSRATARRAYRGGAAADTVLDMQDEVHNSNGSCAEQPAAHAVAGHSALLGSDVRLMLTAAPLPSDCDNTAPQRLRQHCFWYEQERHLDAALVTAQPSALLPVAPPQESAMSADERVTEWLQGDQHEQAAEAAAGAMTDLGGAGDAQLERVDQDTEHRGVEAAARQGDVTDTAQAGRAAGEAAEGVAGAAVVPEVVKQPADGAVGCISSQTQDSKHAAAAGMPHATMARVQSEGQPLATTAVPATALSHPGTSEYASAQQQSMQAHCEGGEHNESLGAESGASVADAAASGKRTVQQDETDVGKVQRKRQEVEASLAHAEKIIGAFCSDCEHAAMIAQCSRADAATAMVCTLASALLQLVFLVCALAMCVLCTAALVTSMSWRVPWHSRLRIASMLASSCSQALYHAGLTRPQVAGAAALDCADCAYGGGVAQLRQVCTAR